MSREGDRVKTLQGRGGIVILKICEKHQSMQESLTKSMYSISIHTLIIKTSSDLIILLVVYCDPHALTTEIIGTKTAEGKKTGFGNSTRYILFIALIVFQK